MIEPFIYSLYVCKLDCVKFLFAFEIEALLLKHMSNI